MTELAVLRAMLSAAVRAGQEDIARILTLYILALELDEGVGEPKRMR
jgi:hypothetical protein